MSDTSDFKKIHDEFLRKMMDTRSSIMSIEVEAQEPVKDDVHMELEDTKENLRLALVISQQLVDFLESRMHLLQKSMTEKQYQQSLKFLETRAAAHNQLIDITGLEKENPQSEETEDSKDVDVSKDDDDFEL